MRPSVLFWHEEALAMTTSFTIAAASSGPTPDTRAVAGRIMAFWRLKRERDTSATCLTKTE